MLKLGDFIEECYSWGELSGIRVTTAIFVAAWPDLVCWSAITWTTIYSTMPPMQPSLFAPPPRPCIDKRRIDVTSNALNLPLDLQRLPLISASFMPCIMNAVRPMVFPDECARGFFLQIHSPILQVFPTLFLIYNWMNDSWVIYLFLLISHSFYNFSVLLVRHFFDRSVIWLTTVNEFRLLSCHLLSKNL